MSYIYIYIYDISRLRVKGSTPHWQALDAAQMNVTPVRAESFDIMGWGIVL